VKIQDKKEKWFIDKSIKSKFKNRGEILMINLTKKQLAILVGIGAVMIFVIIYYIYTGNSYESYEQLDIISEEVINEKEEIVENDIEEIVIHIAGEVKNPGIVRIGEGARIADVIEQAGGLTEIADITNINLAYIIEDGQKITIPSKQINEEVTEYITAETEAGIIEETTRKRNNH